jgi:hypothetical protein
VGAVGRSSYVKPFCLNLVVNLGSRRKLDFHSSSVVNREGAMRTRHTDGLLTCLSVYSWNSAKLRNWFARSLVWNCDVMFA